jgi:hypothetical protein
MTNDLTIAIIELLICFLCGVVWGWIIWGKND